MYRSDFHEIICKWIELIYNSIIWYTLLVEQMQIEIWENPQAKQYFEL